VTTKNNKAVLGILLVVFLSFVLLMIFASYTIKNLSGKGEGINFSDLKEGKSIAVVEVNGVIMESKKIIELLERAYEDKETKAIIMRINSPGGAVAPTQEIYEEMRRIDQEYEDSEGEKGKPIYASFGSVAASGGYYLGAGARRIYSNAGTITGSIGVIMQNLDLSKLYEWAMVKQVNIKAGRYKDMGQPNRGLTQEERDILNNMISGVHNQFIRDIERTRKGKIKGDLRELAQGQIFSGEQARDLGLVDEVASLWQAGRKIHEELKIEKEFGLKYIEKKKKKGLWAIMDNIDEASTNLNLFSQFLGKMTGKVEGHMDNSPILLYQ
jgi:protease-4|tara:strand:- start:174651 stop:175628 length:978 start_codon:yes stop_codon:yes gene_type:complete